MFFDLLSSTKTFLYSRSKTYDRPYVSCVYNSAAPLFPPVTAVQTMQLEMGP